MQPSGSEIKHGHKRRGGAEPHSAAAPIGETSRAAIVARDRIRSLLVYVACVLAAWPLIATSWRRSCDPIVDFGRELYIPWRLSEGAVLFRDVFHSYGPLSQYYHALWFELLGPGLSPLMGSNLVIYFTMLGLLTHLLSRGWNHLTALAGGLVFVLVFSFSQITHAGNYNFLTPYLHETTHGLLVGLTLIAVLASCQRKLRAWNVLAAGLLCGTSVLLKPEPMLACSLAIVASTIVAFWNVGRGLFARKSWANAGLFVLGGLLPTLLMTLAFGLFAGVGWRDAAEYANMAWYGVFKYASIIKSPDQQVFLGTDNVAENLASLAMWSVSALGLLVATTVTIRWASFRTLGLQYAIYFAAVIVAAIIGFSVKWGYCGKLLPLFLGLAVTVEIVRIWRQRTVDEAQAVRLLLIVVAAGFLTRMALNPRIYQYGFVQAPIAAMVAVGFLVHVWPQVVSFNRAGQLAYTCVLAVVGLIGCGTLVAGSQELLNRKTFPIGSGDDLIYAFDPAEDRSGPMFAAALRVVQQIQPHEPLLVLPEGVLLNYMLRTRGPIPEFQFLPSALANGQAANYVQELERNPPPVVVILPRDLREHGVMRYGESRDHGEDLIEWLRTKYHVAHRQGDPLDPDYPGWAILLRRP